MTFKERRKALGFKSVKAVADAMQTSSRTVEKWDMGIHPVPNVAWAFLDLYEKFLHIQETINGE